MKLWTNDDERKLLEMMRRKKDAGRVERDFIAALNNDEERRSQFLEKIGLEPAGRRRPSDEELFASIDERKADVLRHLDAIQEKDFWRMVDDQKSEILERWRFKVVRKPSANKPEPEAVASGDVPVP